MNNMQTWLDKLVIDGTLFLDNSRLEVFTTCPRAAQYQTLEGRISSETKHALKFGEAMHLALKLRYALQGSKEADKNCTDRQCWLMEEFFKLNETPIGDHRTLGYACDMIKKYNVEYKEEPFSLVGFGHSENLTVSTLVEEPFAVKLGQTRGLNIVWTGRIDLGVNYDGKLWVVDHKTSSIGGDYFFKEFYNSSQMLGYCYALQTILGRPAQGVLMNALFTRKQTKTGAGIEFGRCRIEYDQERIAEWVVNTLSVIGTLIDQVRAGFLPMHTKWCVAKYGQCQYYNVCTLTESARRHMLYNTGDYTEDKWSPLHDDALDLKKFMHDPMPESFTTASPQPAVDLGYMADLLS